MAALLERNGSFRLIFWYHGKQPTFTIGQVSEDEAKVLAPRIANRRPK
jgi:hypothetical protein